MIIINSVIIKHLSLEYHSICNLKCNYCSDTYYVGLKAKYNINDVIIVSGVFSLVITDIIQQIIQSSIKNNIGILVHCKAGHTRSANIVALYLYHEFFDNYHDSINFVRNLREHTLKSESRILKYFSKKYS